MWKPLIKRHHQDYLRFQKEFSVQVRRRPVKRQTDERRVSVGKCTRNQIMVRYSKIQQAYDEGRRVGNQKVAIKENNKIGGNYTELTNK